MITKLYSAIRNIFSPSIKTIVDLNRMISLDSGVPKILSLLDKTFVARLDLKVQHCCISVFDEFSTSLSHVSDSVHEVYIKLCKHNLTSSPSSQ
jgi:hypothetical protein